MKIAVDVRMSGKSGIGTFIDEVLPFLIQNTDDTFVLTGTEQHPLYNKPNVKFIKTDVNPFSIKETFFFPKDIVKEINSCDVYFTPYCNIPSGIKIPVFSTIHDIVFLDVKGLSSFLGTKARKFFYKRCIRKSKELFTVSKFSRERIQKKLKCSKPLNVVYNGLPSYLEEPSAPAQKTEDIIFIGNIKKHKGLSTLLKAFNILRSTQNFSSRLIIVGSKENFRTQDDEISALLKNETNGIVFTGFLPDEKLKELLSSSRVLVQPSLYEGFGIPPLQALFAGTEAVISDIPVFKEIYRDFPVTFFKCGDESDLAQKLKDVLSKKTSPALTPEQKEKYSYKKTAGLISECLHK